MKTNRAEQIAALVVDPHSGFKTNDEGMLETCSDERLAEFRAASDARRVEEQKARNTDTELTKANARLKVTEEKLRSAEQAPTEEQWLEKAPARIKVLLDAEKAEEDAVRAAIVSKLKDLGANTEAELNAKTTDQLRELAEYARVSVPDFSGRGVPKERFASSKTANYAPPDPYAPGLEKMRNSSKMVN
jgi:hemerythrin superfamily protein